MRGRGMGEKMMGEGEIVVNEREWIKEVVGEERERMKGKVGMGIVGRIGG